MLHYTQHACIGHSTVLCVVVPFSSYTHTHKDGFCCYSNNTHVNVQIPHPSLPWNLLQMLEKKFKGKRGKRLTSNWVHNCWNRFKQNTLALRIV